MEFNGCAIKNLLKFPKIFSRKNIDSDCSKGQFKNDIFAQNDHFREVTPDQNTIFHQHGLVLYSKHLNFI